VSQEREEIVRRCFAGIEQEPMELNLDVMDPEVELRNPPDFPLRGPFYGHDGVRQWASEIWEVFASFHNEIEEIIEVDDRTLISVQRTRGRMRHTQLSGDTEWATVWRFRNGKVWRGDGYRTKDEALKAAGMSK
jgi:ketosteroid isomerase-like protein